MLLLDTPPADRHTVLEDVQGILVGATLVALAIQFLRASELFTGQIAGLALIVSYPTGYSFGGLFFLMNLPFYVLAVTQLGWTFTLKSIAAVSLMSSMAETLPLVLTINDRWTTSHTSIVARSVSVDGSTTVTAARCSPDSPGADAASTERLPVMDSPTSRVPMPGTSHVTQSALAAIS